MNSLNFYSHQDSKEIKTLQESFQKFAERELQEKKNQSFEHFSRSIFQAMGRAGLTGSTAPTDLGGSNLSTFENALLIFEISRRELSPAVYLSVHLMVTKLLSKFWTNNAAKKFIPRLASGEFLGAFCLTEASAGSDAAALRTKAAKNENGFVLNGEKIYITSAGFADLYLIFARTSEDQKKGISAFAVSKDTTGISFGSPEKKMGCEGSPIATVTLTDCFVPTDHLVGAEGEGYKIALSGLAGGRINIATAGAAMSARATELATQHAQNRKQFGQSIAEFQGIQFMLADMWMRTRASILFARDAALELDLGDDSILKASGAKCFATDQAMSVTNDAVQIFGGAGYLKDYEVEKLMRDAKMLQIVEGTNQIQRIVIAREIMK